EGARVLAVDINADRLAETAAQAKELTGQIVPRVADLRVHDECFAVVEEAVAEFGQLNVLGNVAGVLRVGHVTEQAEETYRHLFAVNTDAYFFLSQAAIPHLLETRGNIVNIASNSGLMGGAYTVAYCMTKGAVVQLTKALAMEFMKRKIRINAIAPGSTDTNIMQGVEFPEDAEWDLIMRYSTPHRRPATPAQIAGLFAFVASDEGLNVHGAILSSDAGMTAG
ncbi:MAG TPA: SDR family oxidoreductase, partial [Frankiaceae bacterium]|nr:SDR family oxidoreductase [Frankiaceae bacterium]